jgi:hypothetical protein
MSDYRNPSSDLPNPTTQTSYNGCADACDTSTVNGNQCIAFTWVPALSSANCILKTTPINGLISTTNMTQTSGIMSGRWLITNPIQSFNQPGGLPPGTTGQTNNLYLKRPTPLPCGNSSININVPSYPGGTNTYFNGWAANAHTTPLDLSSQYSIQFQIFDSIQSALFINANGILTTSQLSLTSTTQNTYSVTSRNNDTAPRTFPTNTLPDYTLSPFWTAGFILQTTQQGIYYQVDVLSPGRYGISIEFWFSHFQQDHNVYRWITTYDTGTSGTWNHYIFSSGVSGNTSGNSDQGFRQSVGAQGAYSVSGNSAPTLNYENGQVGSVLPGDLISMQTGSTPFTISDSPNAFNPANVGNGSWTYQTRPA